MAFSISPPPAPPPPSAAAVFNELEQAAEETADAVVTLVDQVLDDAVDELMEVDAQGREIRRRARAVLDDAAREEDRLLAGIVGSSLSFLQDRQQEARQFGADAKIAVLIMIAVVLVVLAVMTSTTSSRARSPALIRAVEALMALARRGVKQAGGDGAPGNQGGAPAGQGDEMERVLLPLVANLHMLRMSRDRVQTRLLLLKAIRNAVNALTAGSRQTFVPATLPAPWVPSVLARLARCLTRLEARLRIRGITPPALTASQGLTRMRGSLAETAQLAKPPVVIAARPGPKALPSRPATQVPR